MERSTTDEQRTDGGTARDVSPLIQLFTPRSKAAIVATLIEAGGEPKTVSELGELSEKVNSSAFNRYKGDLKAVGLLVEAGKRGNAQTYRLDTDGPVGPALQMVDELMREGETPLLLDEEYLVDGESSQ